MAETCAYCLTNVDGTEPRAELLCHHFCHTQCFLANFGEICPTCEAPLFPNEDQEEDEGPLVDDAASVQSNTYENEQTRVETLFTTNEHFRKDLQKYMKAQRGLAKPKQAFRKLLAAKKEELKPLYTQIKAQYEGHYNLKKTELTSSPEYKAYRSAEAKMDRYWSLLREKYEIRSSSLHTLQQKRGFKTIRRPRYWGRCSSWLIRRAIRLRLPWY